MTLSRQNRSFARRLRRSVPLVLLVAVVAAAGCERQLATPGYGGRPQVHVVDGTMRFVLRLSPGRAQAARISPMFPPDFREVALRAQRAVIRETGCIPVWVVGDPSVVEMGLSCDGTRAPARPRGRQVACRYLEAAGSSDCR